MRANLLIGAVSAVSKRALQHKLGNSGTWVSSLPGQVQDVAMQPIVLGKAESADDPQPAGQGGGMAGKAEWLTPFGSNASARLKKEQKNGIDFEALRHPYVHRYAKEASPKRTSRSGLSSKSKAYVSSAKKRSQNRLRTSCEAKQTLSDFAELNDRV